DLHNFAEDLKQEGKLPADEPAILPPLPLVPKNEKRKLPYITPHSKKVEYRNREWDHRDRDFELMPPPGGFKRDYPVPLEMDQPIDPNEPTYCVCHQIDSHVKRLDEDLHNFAEDLKQGLIRFTFSYSIHRYKSLT
nr:PHD finger protein ING2 [Tanacetum cinerariifolium]